MIYFIFFIKGKEVYLCLSLVPKPGLIIGVPVMFPVLDRKKLMKHFPDLQTIFLPRDQLPYPD